LETSSAHLVSCYFETSLARPLAMLLSAPDLSANCPSIMRYSMRRAQGADGERNLFKGILANWIVCRRTTALRCDRSCQIIVLFLSCSYSYISVSKIQSPNGDVSMAFLGGSNLTWDALHNLLYSTPETLSGGVFLFGFALHLSEST